MSSCGREIDGQDVDCRGDGLGRRRILPVCTSRCLPLIVAIQMEEARVCGGLGVEFACKMNMATLFRRNFPCLSLQNAMTRKVEIQLDCMLGRGLEIGIIHRKLPTFDENSDFMTQRCHLQCCIDK